MPKPPISVSKRREGFHVFHVIMQNNAWAAGGMAVGECAVVVVPRSGGIEYRCLHLPRSLFGLNEKRVTLTFCVFIQQKPCLPSSQNQLETGRSDIIPYQRCQYLHPRLAYLIGQ